jgi:hypothetical protein
MVEANEINRRLRNIKRLKNVDEIMKNMSDVAMRQGDYLAAQKFVASIAVNEAEIERLKDIGPNVRIFL